jgi:hydrogenase nickel incorporation protein HypB
LITKTDLLPYLPVDLQRFEAHIREVNPRCTVLPVSAINGDGLEAWYRWVLSSCAALRADPSPSVLVPA